MITTATGKRQRKKKAMTRVTKPFRPPRQTQRGVIPGLLFQTKTEKKVLYTGSSDGVNIAMAFNTTGSVVPINLIQVGSSMFNRIGRKVEMRSVRLTGKCSTAPVTRATVNPDFARIMIIYDRQTNGANPAMADFLQDTDQAGVNLTEAYSGLNMNNRERFVTIMDIKFGLPQATATAGVLTNVYPNDSLIPVKIDEFRRLRGLTTHFRADSNPAVIGDIATGGLFLISLSEEQTAGTELFQFEWNIRLKYVDV